MSGPEPAEIVARDGTPLAYHLVGSGLSRLALVHSLAKDYSFWRPVAERLANIATILAWDCSGHGSSGKPPCPYSVEFFADDLADILAGIEGARRRAAGPRRLPEWRWFGHAFRAAHPDRVDESVAVFLKNDASRRSRPRRFWPREGSRRPPDFDRIGDPGGIRRPGEPRIPVEALFSGSAEDAAHRSR